MANTVPFITATINSDGTWNFNLQSFELYPQGINSFTLNLEAPGGSSAVFDTVPITWFDPNNPETAVVPPSGFTTVPTSPPPGTTSLIITDTNTDPTTTMYSFKINALYNELLVQSPDPTIINTGTGSNQDGAKHQVVLPAKRQPAVAKAA